MTEEQANLPGTVRPIITTAHKMAIAEEAARASRERFPDPTPPQVILSLDIETLALGPRPVVTEVALLGFDLEEEMLLPSMHSQYYPVQPQLRLLPPREIHVDTLITRARWTNTLGIDFAEELYQSSSDDFEDLGDLIRNLIFVFNQLTAKGTLPYELVCARPQFDVVAMETLIRECGFEPPWDFRSVVDVRTMLKRAGINHKNVPMPRGFKAHTAIGDARWQVDQYRAAIRGTEEVL